MVTDHEHQPPPPDDQPGLFPAQAARQAEEGGDSACWARLVCPECGAMTTEGHRPGCELARPPGPGPG
jgi:hypothetical protein